MRTLIPFVVVTAIVFGVTSARAHLAEGSIALTVDQEAPTTPTGTSPNAGGTANLELSESLTIEYDVTVHDLTGPALAGHIHAGAPGVAGDIVFAFTKVSDTEFQGETDPLTPAQLTTLLAGGFYANVHTGKNGGGEVRGQIHLDRVPSACPCNELSRKDFLKCVRGKVKDLPKEDKKAGRALKKAAKRSICGLTQTRKSAACCLAPLGVGEIVQGELCAPVAEKKAEKQCAALGGTILPGQSCVPTNDCPLPASPSGAFVD